jgi:hypothetical protein
MPVRKSQLDGENDRSWLAAGQSFVSEPELAQIRRVESAKVITRRPV